MNPNLNKNVETDFAQSGSSNQYTLVSGQRQREHRSYLSKKEYLELTQRKRAQKLTALSLVRERRARERADLPSTQHAAKIAEKRAETKRLNALAATPSPSPSRTPERLSFLERGSPISDFEYLEVARGEQYSEAERARIAEICATLREGTIALDPAVKVIRMHATTPSSQGHPAIRWEDRHWNFPFHLRPAGFKQRVFSLLAQEQAKLGSKGAKLRRQLGRTGKRTDLRPTKDVVCVSTAWDELSRHWRSIAKRSPKEFTKLLDKAFVYASLLSYRSPLPQPYIMDYTHFYPCGPTDRTSIIRWAHMWAPPSMRKACHWFPDIRSLSTCPESDFTKRFHRTYAQIWQLGLVPLQFPTFEDYLDLLAEGFGAPTPDILRSFFFSVYSGHLWLCDLPLLFPHVYHDHVIEAWRAAVSSSALARAVVSEPTLP